MEQGEGPQEIEFKAKEVDLEKSHKTFERLERLRQLNSKKEWVNDDLYRLMYKVDPFVKTDTKSNNVRSLSQSLLT